MTRATRQTYPDCPTCETDLLVEHSPHNETYQCHGCGDRWTPAIEVDR